MTESSPGKDVFALEALLPLKDDRVLVDQLRATDAEAFLANAPLKSDIYWPVSLDPDEVSRWLGRATGARNPALLLAIRAGGSLVGGLDARLLTADLGTLDYWNFPAHRGRGYALSAVGLARDGLRAACDLAHIQIRVRTDNAASLAIARRLGFIEVDRLSDEIVFHG